MRPHGRASVSTTNPRAFGICDRCGFLYNHNRLSWQFDYAGASLINKRILVCNSCNDTPQSQLRAIVLPADPVPIQNPRVQNYQAASSTDVTISAPTVTDPVTGLPIPPTMTIATQDGIQVETQPIGRPVGLDYNAIMGSARVTLNPLSITSNGTSTITVTFSAAHGLTTNDQIAVQGLINNNADGMYSITVTTGTAFTYQVNHAIPAANLIRSTTLMVTGLAGLPYGYDQIPLTGV